jgi:heme A synthase
MHPPEQNRQRFRYAKNRKLCYFKGAVILLTIFWRKKMNMSAPKTITWWIAVVIGVLGILVNAGVLALPLSAFLLVAIAFILLALATVIKGL